MCTNSLSRIISFTSRNILSNRNIRLNPCYNTGLSESILLRYAEQAAGRSKVEAQQAELSTLCEVRHEEPTVLVSAKTISSQLQPTQVSQDRILGNGTKTSAEVEFRSVAPGEVTSEIGFSKSKLATSGKAGSKVSLKSSLNENGAQKTGSEPYSVPKQTYLSTLLMRDGGDDVPKQLSMEVGGYVQFYETQIELKDGRTIDRSIIIDISNIGEIYKYAQSIYKKIIDNQIIDGYIVASDKITFAVDSRLGYHLTVLQSGSGIVEGDIIPDTTDITKFDGDGLGTLNISTAKLKVFKTSNFAETNMVQIVAIPDDEFIKRLKDKVAQLPGVIACERSYFIGLFTVRMFKKNF